MDIQHPMIQNALELYCQWLNMWGQHSDPEDSWDIKPQDFQEYSKVLTTVDYSYGSDTIAVIEANNGDDGGPATLTVWAHKEEPHEVHHIVQEFDTYVQSIYDATMDSGSGRFLSTP